MFEIRAFYWAGYFSGKAEEPLNQNKRFKNQLWVWGTLQFQQSQWALSILWIIQKRSSVISFLNFFSYMLSPFYQNLPRIIIIQIPTILEFYTHRIKSVQSGYYTQNRTVVNWRYMINKSSKDSIRNHFEYFSDLESSCQI